MCVYTSNFGLKGEESDKVKAKAILHVLSRCLFREQVRKGSYLGECRMNTYPEQLQAELCQFIIKPIQSLKTKEEFSLMECNYDAL